MFPGVSGSDINNHIMILQCSHAEVVRYHAKYITHVCTVLDMVASTIYKFKHMIQQV